MNAAGRLDAPGDATPATDACDARRGAPAGKGIALAGVSFRYGEVVVARELDLDVPRGAMLVVTGENGVGKSTLLYLCAGLLPPDAGQVRLAGVRPDRAAPSALFRAGIRRGFVFQQGGLISNLSALGNVALALRYHADVLSLSEADILARARAALQEVDVDRADHGALPALLSVGVRRRVALARAVALDATFMFFDDPDAGLDAESAAVVAGLLVRCRDDPRVTSVVATNHRALLERLEVEPRELAGGRLHRRAARNVM